MRWEEPRILFISSLGYHHHHSQLSVWKVFLEHIEDPLEQLSSSVSWFLFCMYICMTMSFLFFLLMYLLLGGGWGYMLQSSMKIRWGANNFLFNFTFFFFSYEFLWGRVGYNGIAREGDLSFQCDYLFYVVGTSYLLFWCYLLRNCVFGK